MATVRRHVDIDVDAVAAWDSVRDYGALHTRLVPGLVVDCELVDAGAARMVTFGNGWVVRERLVSSDDALRRLCWSIVAEGVAHHNGALEVTPGAGDGCRVIWTADALPDGLFETWAPYMERALATMKSVLEAASPLPRSPENA